MLFSYRERQPTKYGFVEKVVDGMYVQINSVVVSFKSTSFLATVNMSRLNIRSTSHEWEPADLRLTRIKDDLKGQVLTFKQITWSTLRIDANALYNVSYYKLGDFSPLSPKHNISVYNICLSQYKSCSFLVNKLWEPGFSSKKVYCVWSTASLMTNNLFFRDNVEELIF